MVQWWYVKYYFTIEMKTMSKIASTSEEFTFTWIAAATFNSRIMSVRRRDPER